MCQKSSGAAVTRHYSQLIRRVRNPAFVNRRSGHVRTAAEWLFDEVDALTYAARQWGGPTCQLLTLWAFEEIGELRDARYLFAALATEAREVRLRVMGGLALLRPAGAEERLRRHILNDVDASVRECALWALGMLIGHRADEVLREAAAMDAEGRVRRAAQRFLGTGANWWWRV